MIYGQTYQKHIFKDENVESIPFFAMLRQSENNAFKTNGIKEIIIGRSKNSILFFF